MTMKFYFHSDAAHGWLKVEARHIVFLDLIDLISPYSYRDTVSRYVYLEEDADAPLFLDAVKARNMPYEVQDVHDGDRSQIRNYPHYKSSHFHKHSKQILVGRCPAVPPLNYSRGARC